MPGYREIAEVQGRLFAIGDVHGCYTELCVLLESLIKNEKLSSDDQVIFIGDYIDRGPDSRSVIDRLLEFHEQFPKTVFLKGNHEDMLLGYLGLPGSMGDVYLLNGGNEMLASYGIKRDSKSPELFMAMPEAHRDFFMGLERYVISENYVFAHAGLDPLRALASQIDEDLFWIRDEFINNIHHFEKMVVFGHTPFEEVVFHAPYKMGIDTGLVFGNKLSCVELTTGRVLQVARGATEVKVMSIPPS